MANAKQIKDYIMEKAQKIKNEGMTLTQPGSLKYLMLDPNQVSSLYPLKWGKLVKK